MQQYQKKSEATSKKTSSIANLMIQRDKERVKTQQRKAYIELLKEPRGKKYLSLLAKITSLRKQFIDVEAEIKKLEAELKNEAVTLPISKNLNEIVEEIEITSESLVEEVQKENKIDIPWKQEMLMSKGIHPKESTIQVSWKNPSMDTGEEIKRFKEKQQRLMEMKKQRKEITEQFRTAQREFEAQLPVPEKLLGMLYPSINENILIKYGVIDGPGYPANSPEELFDNVQPRNEEEERQWLKGLEVSHTYYCDELLIVEVYMDVICVVYKNGNTTVIE